MDRRHRSERVSRRQAKHALHPLPGTADLLFVLPGREEKAAQVVACTRDQLVQLIETGKGEYPGWRTLLRWTEGGAMERNLHALGRGLHGGDELQRYNYLRDENVVLQLTEGLTEGLPEAVSMVAQQLVPAIADYLYVPPCSFRTALLPHASTSRKRSTRTGMELNHHFHI